MDRNEEAGHCGGNALDRRRPQLGLGAIAQFDLVAALFGLEVGETNVATRIVYGLVGLAAVYALGALVSKRGPITEGRGLSAPTTQ